MRHPFAVGIGVGVVGIEAWWKRHTIKAWFDRARGSFSGAEADPAEIVRRLLDSNQPMVLVIATGNNGQRVQTLVNALRTGQEPRAIIDAEGWPSARVPGAVPAN